MRVNLIILLIIVILLSNVVLADSFQVYVMDIKSNDFVHLNITGDNLTVTEVSELFGNYTPIHTINASDRTINCYGFIGSGSMK